MNKKTATNYGRTWNFVYPTVLVKSRIDNQSEALRDVSRKIFTPASHMQKVPRLPKNVAAAIPKMILENNNYFGLEEKQKGPRSVNWDMLNFSTVPDMTILPAFSTNKDVELLFDRIRKARAFNISLDRLFSGCRIEIHGSAIHFSDVKPATKDSEEEKVYNLTLVATAIQILDVTQVQDNFNWILQEGHGRGTSASFLRIQRMFDGGATWDDL